MSPFCRAPLPLAALALPLWINLATDATAQYFTCSGDGPGQRMVGMTQAGNGVASVPLCEAIPDAGGYADAPPPPPYDPLQAQVDAQLAWLMIAADTLDAGTEARAQAEADPKYQAYRDGVWAFGASDAGGARSCTAFYATLDGAILVGGKKGDPGGTFLTFMGPSIPAPGSVRKVKVTLEQTDSAPQTVKALNHKLDGGMGAISFAVPLDISGASDMFLDQQDFRLVLKGEPVFAMGWHSGMKAQRAIRKCAG